MKIFSSRATWGLLLIGAGVVFLLQNFNLLPQNSIFWGGAFGIAGIFFLLGFFANRDNWWAAFPAFTLFGLAFLMLWEIFPTRIFSQDLTGAIFLGFLGLSFIAVYLREPRHWWAIIPAGALLSIAGVVALETLVRDPGPVEIGGILFIGMGVTFLLVYILPSAGARNKWAIWPAISLLLFGGLITAAATDLLGVLWPVGLILAGLFVLLRGFRR